MTESAYFSSTKKFSVCALNKQQEREIVKKTFFMFFESLVEVLEDFAGNEEKKNEILIDSQIKDHPLNNEVLNLSSKEKREKYIGKIQNKFLFMLNKLDFQFSTVIIVFIYLDRIIRKKECILTWKTFEK